MLSILRSQESATVRSVAESMMIPASYAWVVAESLADLGLVASTSRSSDDDQSTPDFYDSRSLTLNELIDQGTP
jgi:hypothetical protein